jgi:predicted dehydrogenase
VRSLPGRGSDARDDGAAADDGCPTAEEASSVQQAKQEPSTTRTVGVGVIGTGFMGGIHARAYGTAPWIFPDATAQPLVRIVADERLADARVFAQRFGIPEWTDDWRSLLTRSDLDVIDICTPPSLHQRIATAVAGAGKHVYCEKPVGRGLDETTAIWEAVKAAGVSSFVGFNFRMAPAAQLGRQIVESGRIGEIRHVRVSYRTNYDNNPDQPVPWRWRFSQEVAGAGALADLGSHAFDMAVHLAGPIRRVCGMTHTFVTERDDPDQSAGGGRRVIDNDDAFAALVELSNGAIGIVDASRASAGSKTEFTFDVSGSAGAVRWDMRRMNELQVCYLNAPETEQGFTTVQTGPVNDPYGRFIPSPLGLGYADTKVIEVHRLAEAVASGEPISPSLEDMVQVARLIEAVQRGGWVDVGSGS